MPTAFAAAVGHPVASRASRSLRRATRWTVRPLLATVPIGERSFARMRQIERLKPRRPGSGVTTEVLDLGGVRAESMTPLGGATRDAIVLYFHGGGFFSGSVASHRSLTELLAVESGATVVSVDYRLVPEAGVAGSVDDALTAYGALVAGGARVAVAGDSAGGYLALKIAELSGRRGLPAPRCVVGFSALTDLQVDPGAGDPFLPARRVPQLRRHWLADGPAEGEESLLDAAAEIACPVHLVAVEDELLRPQIEALAVRLAGIGADVDLHLWRGQIHAFVSFVDLLPDAREAVRIAAGFLARHSA